MDEVLKKPVEELATSFIPLQYLPDKNDPFYYVNRKKGKRKCRSLTDDELDILIANNNFADDWEQVLVTDNFDPNLVKNCQFMGYITIGDLTPSYLQYHELKLPVGITNSTIFSCDIGDNVVIRDVHYLAHYIIGNKSILFNIDEMTTSNHAKFGNGIIKEGEDETVRIWLEICNENGGRKVLPFDSMITADAWLWSKYRDDLQLLDTLKKITDASYNLQRGEYGEIGKSVILKNSRIIKDVKIGNYAYIKGANKLKNLTILSSKDEPSQIGEGVELVNGIVGYGNKIFYGCKAVRFVTGRNTQLKYGARLINSVLGDNSTVSCCELLNNLIFPFHEQHHNNSFLISTTVMGQSNIAAGATIGSNHNSRAPDGEIVAGRGFWPGLCTNFKHNCRFASYTLIAKGSYSYEMDIRYPFSLIYSTETDTAIQIMPAYWFLYNMYAVARNSWKFVKRDQRVIKIQHIESDFLAPDTVSEIITAMDRIALLIGMHARGDSSKTDPDTFNDTEKNELIKRGRNLLESGTLTETPLQDPTCMKKHGGVLTKPVGAWNIYRDFLYYYAVNTLIIQAEIDNSSRYSDLCEAVNRVMEIPLHTNWINMGGQIMPDDTVISIKDQIKAHSIKTWNDIHTLYDTAWEQYPSHKVRHALHILELITGSDILDLEQHQWQSILEKASDTAIYIEKQAHAVREKDYNDPYRKINYDNDEEMIAVLGRMDDNPFLDDLTHSTEIFIKTINSLKQ